MMVWEPGNQTPAQPSDARLHAPATVRNRDAILAVLRTCLPERGLVLEIASGSGEHIVHFAAACGPDLVFQPSDPDAAARASIDAWAADAGLANIRAAIDIDAGVPGGWPIAAADAVVCINMVHIAPWEATVGLMRGAGRFLAPGGVLFLYGPYREGGRHTAPSNEAFDRDLRARNPDWGVRDREAVASEAEGNGFAAPTVHPMPANNLALLFRRNPLGL
jgi:SAM-dependent methyltransferase